MVFRIAHASDLQKIIDLHVRSWQKFYRNILPDSFLEVGVYAHKREEWEARFHSPESNMFLLVAEENGILQGFSCAFSGKDAQYGTLLDNLHVLDRGKGTGRILLQKTIEWAHGQGDKYLHLWVLKGNDQAIEFYRRMGGAEKETISKAFHSPEPVEAIRFVWETNTVE